MLKVFITVDTELWPNDRHWPRQRLAPGKTDFGAELARDIDGHTTQGSFGLPYQIATFARYGLKATYFVEALFAGRVGAAPLHAIVRQVQDAGHEVQLHLHTEWLGDLTDPALPGAHRQFMRQFTLQQQSALIRAGMDTLHAAGVPALHAFRAGSYGANLDTLRALAKNGIAIDSSYNPGLQRDWPRAPMLHQARRMEGVLELPISSFRDFPGHVRPTQLCACSSDEMQHALWAAAAAGWYSFVVVLHSFELLKQRDSRAAPDRLTISRFEQLCAFLARHPEHFETCLFSQIDPQAVPNIPHAQALRSSLTRTLRRVGEQALARLP